MTNYLNTTRREIHVLAPIAERNFEHYIRKRNNSLNKKQNKLMKHCEQLALLRKHIIKNYNKRIRRWKDSDFVNMLRGMTAKI